MRVVVHLNFFWLVIFRCFWSIFFFARNLFVTAWSWYGHFSKSLFSLNCDLLHIDWPYFIAIYLWTYRRKVIQQLSGTGHKFSETGPSEYQAYIKLSLSRSQDLLLGATSCLKVLLDSRLIYESLEPMWREQAIEEWSRRAGTPEQR